TITADFKIGDQVFATESAERIPTVDLYVKSKKLTDPNATPKEHVTNYAKVGGRTLKVNSNWLSTEAVHKFDKSSGEDFPPVLVNLRRQSVKDAQGNTLSSVNRSGAITDFGHGEVSLQELKDYPKLVQLSEKLENREIVEPELRE